MAGAAAQLAVFWRPVLGEDGRIHALVHETASRPEAAAEGAQAIYAYFGELFKRRAGSDGDDLISAILRARVDGAPLADESLIPGAAEEFLRLYAPVLGARRVTAETDIVGGRLAEGDRVLLLFGAASRDGRTFPEPDQLRLGRPNAARHLTFGDYIHDCPGIRVNNDANISQL